MVDFQRLDLDLNGNDDERSKVRLMIIYDNRESEVDYAPEAEILVDHLANGVDLSPMFRDDEIDLYIESLTPLASRSNEPQTAESLWQGMPEYKQDDLSGIQQIMVHFETRKDVEDFAKRMEQTITEKTRSIWFPYKAPENLKQYTVEDES